MALKFVTSDIIQKRPKARLAGKISVGKKSLILILAAITTITTGYLIGSGNKFFPWTLIILAPLAIFILIRPFLGLLIFVALIPLESSFLRLGGGVVTVTRMMGVYVFTAWIMQLVVNRQKLKLPPAAKWAIAFIAWSVLSYFWVRYQNAALEKMQTAVQLLLLALLVINQVNSRRRLEITLAVLFAGCFIITILGLLGVGVRTNYPLLSLQNQGAKEYASYVGIVFLIGIILFIFSSGRVKTLAMGAIVIAIIPLIASGERGVILALGLTSVVLAFISRQKIKTVAAIVFFLAIICFIPKTLGHTGLISTSIMERWTIASVIDTGGTGRADIWRAALATIIQNLWIGTGLGNFGLSPSWMDPHNDWLGVAGELGLIGLSIFLFMLTNTGRRLVNVFHDRLAPGRYVIVALVFALWIYSLSVGLASTYMWRKIYWLILAMAISVPDLVVNYVVEESNPDNYSR